MTKINHSLTIVECFDAKLSISSAMHQTGLAQTTVERHYSSLRGEAIRKRSADNVDRIELATKLENKMFDFIKNNHHNRSIECHNKYVTLRNSLSQYCA